tara:strand:- start:33963 stop:34250 length:288 start_codon:yes stop_codon:yes gene_type:complete
MFEDVKYAIMNVSDLTEDIIACCHENSIDTLRKNKDGSKALIKWSGNFPTYEDTPKTITVDGQNYEIEAVSNPLEGVTQYTYNEILEVLKDDDWN